MDEKEFLQKLSEVAEWHRPQTGPNGHPSVSKGRLAKKIEKPEPVTEQQLEEMSEDEVQDYYNRLVKWRESQPNNSVAPEITKLKCKPHGCEDCTRILEESRRVERKIYESGSKHWRERCVNCGQYKNPLTNEYSISPKEVHQFFIQLHRPKLGKYKSKFQPEPVEKFTATPKPSVQRCEVEQLKNKIREYTVVETEDSIIRSFSQDYDDENKKY